jgi:hypothetical protein
LRKAKQRGAEAKTSELRKMKKEVLKLTFFLTFENDKAKNQLIFNKNLICHFPFCRSA